MKTVVAILVIATAGALLLNCLRRRDERFDAANELRTAIGNSNLPSRARDEMRSLLNQRRLRPSQFGDTSV